MLGGPGLKKRDKNFKKSTLLRILNQQQQYLIAIFFSYINLDAYVSMKINTFRIYKGAVWGATPPLLRSRRK